MLEVSVKLVQGCQLLAQARMCPDASRQIRSTIPAAASSQRSELPPHL